MILDQLFFADKVCLWKLFFMISFLHLYIYTFTYC